MVDVPTVHLLRHGEVRGGVRFRGSTDDRLTPSGWRQMEIAVEHRCPWQAIVTSPLRRCADFAHALSHALHVPLTIEPALRELHFGDWEGRSPAEIERSQPGAVHRFWREPWTYTPPGGERLSPFKDRVINAWTAALQRHPTPVLFIVHAGVIRCILCEVYKRPLTEIMRAAIPHGSMHVVLHHRGRGPQKR